MTGKRTTALLLLVCCAVLSARAQDARLQVNHLDRLAATATETVDINLDNGGLNFVAKMLTLSGREQTKIRDLMLRLKGIYVRGYEFEREGEYSAADVEIVRAQLRPPLWRRIVEVRDRNGESTEAYFLPQGDLIGGMALLTAKPKQLCVINVVGALDLEEYSWLEKEFSLSHCGKTSDRRQRRRAK
jgi:hypothetical protein